MVFTQVADGVLRMGTPIFNWYLVVLEVPGRPRVIHAPGHSPGCVAFHFERQRALIVGDVLFELNLLTGRRGPQIGPAAFNTSSD